MKKRIFSLYVLLFSLSFLAGERIVYYKNPHTSLPIVITRSADIDHFDYTYYILNEYKHPVVASYENPREAIKDDFRERFFTSVEDYRREKRIIIEWDYKNDKEKDTAPILKDGTYEIHIIETNKFQKSIRREYVYYIVLDSLAPRIVARLSPDEIKKNNKEFSLIDISKDSVARSWRIFLDDLLIKEENYPYGDERRFPINYLKYEDYMDLPYGEHTLTIIAKDTAMNCTEHRVSFRLVEEARHFSIFSNKEVLFRKDGGLMPLYYTAIGNVVSKNWSCTIKDNKGTVHHRDDVKLLSAGYCKGFKWDGISQLTNEKVPLGTYTLSISCSDELGGSYTQKEKFVVSEEAFSEYLRQESTNVMHLPDGSLLLSCNFEDGKFHFAMKGYEGKVEGARLKIKKGNEVLFETDVEDARNIVWEALDDEGVSMLRTGDEYRAEIAFDDEEERGVFATNMKVPLILGGKEGNRRRVIVDSIHFPGYEVDVLKADKYFTSNGKSIKKTADAVLKNLKDGDILVIVGNANYTTYPDAKKMKSEDELLQDISLKRAEMIKLIFMFYGLSEKQIKVEGNGGKSFVVPPTNKDNWKNRRVDFFIEERVDKSNEY